MTRDHRDKVTFAEPPLEIISTGPSAYALAIRDAIERFQKHVLEAPQSLVLAGAKGSGRAAVSAQLTRKFRQNAELFVVDWKQEADKSQTDEERFSLRKVMSTSAGTSETDHSDVATRYIIAPWQVTIFNSPVLQSFQRSILVALPPLGHRSEDCAAIARRWTISVDRQFHAQWPGWLDDELSAVEFWPNNMNSLGTALVQFTHHGLDKLSPAFVRQTLAILGCQSAFSPAPSGIASLVGRHIDLYLSQHATRPPPPGLWRRIFDEVEPAILSRVLAYCDRHQGRTAELLGMNRNTVREKLRRYGLINLDHQSRSDGPAIKGSPLKTRK